MKIKFGTDLETIKGRPYARVLEVGGKDVPWVWGDWDPRHFIADHLMDAVFAKKTRKDILQELDDVASGKNELTGFGGNAWSSLATRDGVTFYFDVHDGEPNGGKVSLATYRAAIEAWLDFLEDKDRVERIVELPE